MDGQAREAAGEHSGRKRIKVESSPRERAKGKLSVIGYWLLVIGGAESEVRGRRSEDGRNAARSVPHSRDLYEFPLTLEAIDNPIGRKDYLADSRIAVFRDDTA